MLASLFAGMKVGCVVVFRIVGLTCLFVCWLGATNYRWNKMGHTLFDPRLLFVIWR